MGDDNNWHYRIPTADEVAAAKRELGVPDMRNAFADEITRLGAADKRVTLLSGDIGNKRTQLKKTTAAFAALQTGEGTWRM
jgi:hypothetical protein